MDITQRWWASWTILQGVTLSGMQTKLVSDKKTDAHNTHKRIFSDPVWVISNNRLCMWAAIFQNSVNHVFGCLSSCVSFPLPFSLPAYCWHLCVCLCNYCSNRVEAWTRDVQFLLRQEGRPVTQLVGNMSTERIKKVDWKHTDMATQWIHQRAASPHQPFALYLGLNLPHTYNTESLGPTAGGSTFLTSPYWLKKAYFLFLYWVLSLCCCTYVLYRNHYEITTVFYTHRFLLISFRFLNGSPWLPCTLLTTTPPSPKTAVVILLWRKSKKFGPSIMPCVLRQMLCWVRTGLTKQELVQNNLCLHEN